MDGCGRKVFSCNVKTIIFCPMGRAKTPSWARLAGASLDLVRVLEAPYAKGTPVLCMRVPFLFWGRLFDSAR